MTSRRSPLDVAASVLLGEPAELVRELRGGTHAETALIAVSGRRLVIRRFPRGDESVAREVRVLDRIGELGTFVPRLVTYSSDPDDALIITTVVEGGPPDAALAPSTIAHEMGNMLARLHTLDGTGLPLVTKRLPPGNTPIARAARKHPPPSDPEAHVLVHSDFWCGNALWQGDLLSGLVDWSGAGSGSRGVDVAWCRQDLVLLGDPDATDVFLDSYEEAAGVRVADLRAWDLTVGAYAEPVVETWAPNYAGIGQHDVTTAVLRTRLDAWNATLL